MDILQYVYIPYWANTPPVPEIVRKKKVVGWSQGVPGIVRKIIIQRKNNQYFNRNILAPDFINSCHQ